MYCLCVGYKYHGAFAIFVADTFSRLLMLHLSNIKARKEPNYIVLVYKQCQETLTLGSLSEIPREVKGKAFVYKRASLLEVCQHIREHMEAIQ